LFENLSDRLQDVFKKLSAKGRLDPEDVDQALREVRLALIAADVNLKVVRGFIGRIREQTIGVDVLQALNPAQSVIKIVHDELVAMLGEAGRLELGHGSPPVIMLVGLQGAGKTTMAAKLALHLRKSGQRPLMVAADVRRPAAIQQLITLGKQVDIPVYSEPGGDPPAICAHAVQHARETAASVVILDTAGRLHIDDDLMREVEQVKQRTSPGEVLLVADSMTGQEAVNVANAFNARLGVTGLILTKVDGDARGGAALSMREVTGVPIKYLGTGEKLDGIEVFHPDRLASRILGMGDVLTLIERAQANFDEQQARDMEKKLRQATFNYEDFLNQLQQVKKMGPISQLLEMIPGMGNLTRQLPANALDEGQFERVEAIIRSMTRRERVEPHLLDGSRKRRIARGSGTSLQEVNQLVNQFEQMRRMMKKFSRSKNPMGMLGGLR
jgi:signal recognition particle subunit SRP54